ncbi:MAG: M56 family metallopeptidase [Nocardioidaceae bacterium]|nr:M56 family metallopeptidase [Nocardioidaceae bacterium]
MTAPLLLLGLALVVGTVGARWLRNAGWTQRAPRLGILAWLALTASIVLSVTLAGVALALRAVPATTNLADLVGACAMALRLHDATPGGVAVAAAGVAVAAVGMGRIAYCLAVGWMAARRSRAVHRRGLELVAHADPASGALIVRHPTPAAYCLPGRRGDVVLTTAAMVALDVGQLAAVLAHERAHLLGRHDVVLSFANALRAAFPFIPVFATARAELGRLVEMHADDTALVGSDRRVLASALVGLAGEPHPIGTLGAAGEAAVARVRRLVQPATPLGALPSLLAAVGALALVVMPLVIAAAPAVSAVAMGYCPLGLSDLTLRCFIAQ